MCSYIFLWFLTFSYVLLYFLYFPICSNRFPPLDHCILIFLLWSRSYEPIVCYLPDLMAVAWLYTAEVSQVTNRNQWEIDEGVAVVGGLAQGFSLNRPHPRGGTQDTDFNKGFIKGIFTKIFGEDFGGVRGHCDSLMLCIPERRQKSRQHSSTPYPGQLSPFPPTKTNNEHLGGFWGGAWDSWGL